MIPFLIAKKMDEDIEKFQCASRVLVGEFSKKSVDKSILLFQRSKRWLCPVYMPCFELKIIGQF